MRRHAFPILAILAAGLLSGCTGFGVFLDHTNQWFGNNPNAPAGSSETFARIRGEKVDIPPLLPEAGNVWPAPRGPDLSLQDIQKQQNEEILKGGGRSAAANGPGSRVNRANQADVGLPPPINPPPPARKRPTVLTPSGPSLDVGGSGSGRGYRQLQSPSPGGSGILVPNGNGTSTLIGPDGSVKTVPTR